jgi:hypothetical protein
MAVGSTANAIKCPNCGLLNPGNATWCDCGYDFTTGEVGQDPSYSDGTSSRGWGMIWQDSMQRQRAQQSAIASKPGSMWSRFGFILLMVIHHILAFPPLLTFALSAMSHTRPKFDQYDLLYRQYISAMLIVGDAACLGFLPFLVLTGILWRKYRRPWYLCLVALNFFGWFLLVADSLD